MVQNKNIALIAAWKVSVWCAKIARGAVTSPSVHKRPLHGVHAAVRR